MSAATYLGIERPGIPTWKSVMFPELTCPEISPVTLSLASALPPKPTQDYRHGQSLYRDGRASQTRYYIPKVTPNWVSFGGMTVPAATALMPTVAWRLVSMSMEPDPSLNKFFEPEKLTGAGFAETVLLNEPTDTPPNESKIGISAPTRGH